MNYGKEGLLTLCDQPLSSKSTNLALILFFFFYLFIPYTPNSSIPHPGWLTTELLTLIPRVIFTSTRYDQSLIQSDVDTLQTRYTYTIYQLAIDDSTYEWSYAILRSPQ